MVVIEHWYVSRTLVAVKKQKSVHLMMAALKGIDARAVNVKHLALLVPTVVGTKDAKKDSA